MTSIHKIFRSVQAFGREFRRLSIPEAKPAVRIGVALGGGFARGIAHIGALKVIEEEGIPIHCVAGTSVGALVGAAYCSGLSASELEAVARRVRFRNFARWTVSRYGFASNQRMTGFLHSVIQARSFEELAIPLAVSAMDFADGQPMVFRSGPLIDPVRASCAYPGMFLPVNIDGRWFLDGMLAHPVPVHPALELGATHVIAISLKGRWSRGGAPRHLFDVVGQCFAVAQENSAAQWRSAAALVVEPDVNGFDYDDFGRTPELLAAGETAMHKAMPEVRKWLQRRAVPGHEAQVGSVLTVAGSQGSVVGSQ